MQALFLALLALVAVLPFVSCSWIDTIYTGTFTGAQITPVPLTQDPNAGTIACVYVRNTNPKTLDCEVQHSIMGSTLVTINRGDRAESGPVLYQFPLPPSGIFGQNFRYTFPLSDQLSYTVDQQELDLLSGDWHVIITSPDFEEGEIRAQLEHQDFFLARMSSEFTVPIASGTTARGLTLATFTFYDPKRTIQLDVVHSVTTAVVTGAEIRNGFYGVVGNLIHRTPTYKSPFHDSVPYTIGETEELFNDRHYIQILSVANPNGEIRGQLEAIEKYPTIAFTARLEGRQVIPAVNTRARGCALFAYDCKSGLLEYLVFHDTPTAVAASVHAGTQDTSGSLFFDLSRVQNPIFGSQILNREEEFLLYSQQLYVLISSAANPNGELRGQITTEFDFWAYLNGHYVSPPVSSAAVGCAVFQLSNIDNRFTRAFAYSVHHSVAVPTGVDLAIGNTGQNGFVNRVLRRSVSPIIGSNEPLDDDELHRFVNDQMYLQVRSVDYPNGEIRGQINRIDPCLTSRVRTITIPDGQNGGGGGGQNGGGNGIGEVVRYAPAPYVDLDGYSLQNFYTQIIVDSVPYDSFTYDYDYYSQATYVIGGDNNPGSSGNNNNYDGDFYDGSLDLASTDVYVIISASGSAQLVLSVCALIVLVLLL